MPSTEPSCSTITWPMTVGHSIQTNDAKLLKRSKQIQISVTACGSWFWMLIYQLSKSTGNIERHWGAAKHKAEVDKRQEERHNTGEAGETLHRRRRRGTTHCAQALGLAWHCHQVGSSTPPHTLAFSRWTSPIYWYFCLTREKGVKSKPAQSGSETSRPSFEGGDR